MPLAPRPVPVQLEIPGGEQRGGGVLAVVTDRAGAMPFDRKESPVAPGSIFRHDRIGFRPAARNLAVDPAGRPELDRTHPAAFEIVQTPQERDMPDRALYVVCPERFQAGLSAPSATERLAATCSVPALTWNPAIPQRRILRTPRRTLAAHGHDAGPGTARELPYFRTEEGVKSKLRA